MIHAKNKLDVDADVDVDVVATHAHTHTRTHAHARMHTHARTHTPVVHVILQDGCLYLWELGLDAAAVACDPLRKQPMR